MENYSSGRKKFDNGDKISRYRSKHKKSKTCPECSAHFFKVRNLIQHRKNTAKVSCNHCERRFCSNNELQKHLRSIRRKPNEDTSSQTDEARIPDLNQRIYPETGYENEPGYTDLVKHKMNEIKDRLGIRAHYQVINKQITPDFTYHDLHKILLDIYRSRKTAFRINLGIGFILYNTVEEKFKYHYVSTNNLLFEKAATIVCRKDLTDLMRHIVSIDLATNFYLKKPSSRWILAGLTNIHIIVVNLSNTLIG